MIDAYLNDWGNDTMYSDNSVATNTKALRLFLLSNDDNPSQSDGIKEVIEQSKVLLPSAESYAELAKPATSYLENILDPYPGLAPFRQLTLLLFLLKNSKDPSTVFSSLPFELMQEILLISAQRDFNLVEGRSDIRDYFPRVEDDNKRLNR